MSRGFTAAEVKVAIKGSGAIMSTIARRLNCDWTTAKTYVEKWESTKKALHDEDQKIIDLAEGTLYASIKDGNTQDAKWLLAKRRKGKYADRQEVTGADGGAITFALDWGDTVVENDND